MNAAGRDGIRILQQIRGSRERSRYLAMLAVGAVALAMGASALGSLRMLAAGVLAVAVIGICVASNKVGGVLLLVSVFVVPLLPLFPLLRAEETNYNVYVTGLLAGTAVGSVFATRRLRVDAMMLLWAWACVQTVALWGPTELLGDLTSTYNLLLMPATALVFYYLSNQYCRPAQWRLAVQLLLALCVTESLVGIGQSVFAFNIGGPVFWGDRAYLGYLLPGAFSTSAVQATGTFEHFNGLGSLLAIGAPLAWGLWIGRRSVARAAVLAVIVVGLVLTYSRGALIGATCGVVAIEVTRVHARKTAVIVAAAGVVLFAGLLSWQQLVIYYDSTQNLAPRMNTVAYAVAAATERPLSLLTGSGLMYFHSNVLTSGRVLSNLHSSHIQVLLELGLVGFVPYVLYLITLLRQTFRKRDCVAALSVGGAVLAFFVHQTFENVLFGYQGALAVLLCGVAKAGNRIGWGELSHWLCRRDPRRSATEYG